MHNLDSYIIRLCSLWNGWGMVLYVVIVTTCAALMAIPIGLEREMKGQAAGLRTHTLLAVGCALIMSVSIYPIGIALGTLTFVDGAPKIVGGGGNYLGYDAARIAAGILAGIGLVCGGTVIRNGLSVRGLTTAVTLWVVTAVGMACGAGFIMEALVGVCVAILFLLGLSKVEHAMDRRSPRVTLVVKKSATIVADIRAQAEANTLIIKNITTDSRKTRDPDTQEDDVYFAFRSPMPALEDFCEAFSQRSEVLSVDTLNFHSSKND